MITPEKIVAITDRTAEEVGAVAEYAHTTKVLAAGRG